MINRGKLLKFETIERCLRNKEPWVHAEAGLSVVCLDGEFDLEQIRNIYEWLKRNNRKFNKLS
jgi:hypothetical protein